MGITSGAGAENGAVTQLSTAATANCTNESSTGLRPLAVLAVAMMCSA